MKNGMTSRETIPDLVSSKGIPETGSFLIPDLSHQQDESVWASISLSDCGALEEPVKRLRKELFRTQQWVKDRGNAYVCV